MIKRRIAFFLSLCMLLSMFSTVAYAKGSVTLTGAALDDFLASMESKEESIKNDNSDSITSSDKDFVIDSYDVQVETVGATSGTCGDNLTWTLYENGTLTISGEGEMEDYSSSSNAPWYSNRSNIKTVIIQNGVTSIGIRAFYDCYNLTSVKIGNSVTSIGDSAFSYCKALTSITIPDSVTNIGSSAFLGCRTLTSVTIPDSVTSIGDSAFYGCSKLTSITIPDSVTIIGSGTFGNCSSLTEINVVENSSVYSSENGVLFNKDKTTLICYPAGKSDSSYTIPDSVTSIGEGAFYDCSSLASITIPNSVTSIGEGAFEDCSSLASITIPDSVTTIGDDAFSSCESLESITIPDSVTSIGGWAFSWCYSITSVTIPDSVTTIESGAFVACYSLSSITIPDSVVSIGDYAFYECESLTSITIPDSVTSIGSSAFLGCRTLTSVTIPDSVTSIEDQAFGYYYDYNTYEYVKIENFTIIGVKGSAAEAYSIENGITFAEKISSGTCGDNITWTLDDEGTLTISGEGEMWGNSSYSSAPWYSNRSNIKTVIIQDGVTNIGIRAFFDCTSLLSITIPDSVTSIGGWAFSWCYSLTSVTIPDSVTSIGYYAFYSCSSLTDVYYGGTEEQWNEISVSDGNSCLTDSTFHFSHVHSFEESMTSPTCTEDGIKIRTCTVCGGEEREVISALGHSMGEWETETDPTCIADGSKIRTCTVCGGEEEREVIPALGHSMGEWETETDPTCTDDGSKIRTCTVCGEEEREVIPALGHSMGEWETETAPTCIADGSKIRTCTICGEEEREVIPALGHSIGESITSPTCTEDGIIIRTCTVCGEEEREVIPALGHSMGEWETETEPTCAEDGSKIRTCTVCGEEEREVIPALGHWMPDWIIEKEPTCTEDGFSATAGPCERCGYMENLVIFPARHSFMSDDTSQEPTCTEDVIIIRTCTVCGEEEREIIPALGHSFENDICTNCGKKLFETIESPHNYPNSYDNTWEINIPGAEYILITFSPETETEDGCDHIYIYDVNNTQVGRYSGTDLASKTISVNGDVAKIRLTSDGSATRYGFSLSEVSACKKFTSNGVEFLVNAEEIDVSAEFKADEIDSDSITVTLSEDVVAVSEKIYNIYFVKDGQQIQYNGKAFASISVPEDMISEACKIFYVDENGNATDMNAVYENGCMKFTSEQTGYYALIETKFSGKCGDNLTWEFDKNGTLTISGTGEMEDYYDNSPWYSYTDEIKSVIIQDGVTSIGDYAFQYCEFLASITIPESVISISYRAFSGCQTLTSITIPDSVIRIGDNAFSDCTSLTSITIPDSVTSIGYEAFYNTAYYNDETNWANGVLYIGKHLIVAKTDITSCNIKEGTVLISDCAFYGCSCLTFITIPNSVTSIGLSTFYGCTSLTSITIPDSVSKIEMCAFYGCSSLTSITIPNSVIHIDIETFVGCTSLKSITIPESVTSINSHSFSECTSLESINLPNSIEDISYMAFSGCTSLSSITIPISVSNIGLEAFFDCTSLKSITIPATVETIEYNAFGYYYDYDNEEYVKIENFTITGVKGSAAEVYATENGFTFIEMGESISPDDDFYMDEEASTMPNIVENTKASDIISTLGEYGITATITDKNGNSVTGNKVVGTGAVVKTSDGKEYIVIVNGDVDGNGTITSTDYLHIKHSLTGTKLSGCYKTAADTDGNNTISSTDYLTVKAYLVGKAELYK